MTSGISPLTQKLERGQRFLRHRHPYPYAAVVLAGAYREAGSGGRFRVSSGEVMFHDAFDAHLNCVESTGAVILNIPLQSFAAQRAHFGVANVDAIAAIAERDPAAAESELLNSLLELPARAGDWPDLLAADLRRNAALRYIRAGATPLSAIAADAGFSDQAHMTRTIAELTGNPPSHWRV
jgi:hypothetical protein